MSIYHISIQYKGYAGSRGGAYFYIKNYDDPISVILTGNKFALKHVSLMHMCNTLKLKLIYFNNTSCAPSVLLQKNAVKTKGNHVFCSLNISGVRKCKY